MPALNEVPLLGRQSELEMLGASYSGLTESRTRVVLIRGEAGIGKSYLLRAFLEQVRRWGGAVLVGRADAAERTIPYGTLDHALATLPRQTPDVEELVDVLSDEMARRSDSGSAIGGGQPARVVVALTGLLRHLTSEGPAVLAIDDLHATDDDTLALLAAVVRRLGSSPLLLAATVRTDLPYDAAGLERFLDRLSEEGGVRRLELGPLAHPDIEELIERLTGHRPLPAATQVAVDRAGGNPFITTELIEALRQSDGLAIDDDGRLRLREDGIRLGQRGAIIRRLLPTDPTTLRLAQVLSVATDFHVAELTAAARVAGLSESGAEAAFDGLVKARLLITQPDGSYEFRHRILQEALHDSLGPAERRRLHSDLAAVLLQVRHEGHTVPYARIAQHALDAAQGIDESAAGLAQGAGDEMAAVAPRSATTWYERAVELTAPANRERPMRLARLARSLLRSNLLVEAVERGHEALAHLPDGPDRTRCAADTAEALLRFGAGRRALDLLDVELARGAHETRLLVMRVNALAYVQRYEEARFAADKATAAAVPGSTDHLLALAASAALADQLGDRQRVTELIQEQLALAPRLPRHSQQFLYGFASLLLASEWQLREAEPLLARAVELAGTEADIAADDRIETTLMLMDFYRGRWDAALDRAARRGPEFTEHGPSVYLVQAQIIEAQIRASRGDVMGARRRAARSYPDLVPCWVAAQHHTRAWIELLDYRSDDAHSILEQGLGLAPTGSPASMFLSALMATTMHRLGDKRAADHCLEVCEPGGDPTNMPYVAINVLLARAEVTGDAASARLSYEIACREQLCFEMARSQLVCGQLDDESQANLTSAWRTFRSLGATLWRERAVAALRERDLPIPRSRRRDPRQLSETEWQIVRLIGEGLRNRDIAERLAYSPHTVETYISRIYAKTGVSSRTALLRVLDETNGTDSAP